MLSGISIRIESAEYQQFKLAIGDPRLPLSYVQWLGDRSGEKQRWIEQGVTIHEVVARIDEYLRYCGSGGVRPSFSALEEFAAAKLGGIKF
ncbi:MAG TPA: hypothetical protein VN667_11945 [Burkholderiales bacterium]|nr:hypothetical protein [Burkholderiales bacterium]